MIHKGLKKTTPAKTYTIPTVTLDYETELNRQVKRYMADRFNYLAEGRHILDDLSQNEYIDYLAVAFGIPFSEASADFNELGQGITDKKNQESLDKRFKKEGIQLGLSDEELKAKVEQIKDLKQEFIKTKPTKGWNTKKMEVHRDEFNKKVFELFGFKIIKYDKPENSGARKVPYIADDKWIFTEDIFPTYQMHYRTNRFKIQVSWDTNKKRWEHNDIFEFEYVKYGLDRSNYLRVNNRIITL